MVNLNQKLGRSEAEQERSILKVGIAASYNCDDYFRTNNEDSINGVKQKTSLQYQCLTENYKVTFSSTLSIYKFKINFLYRTNE